MPGATPCRPPYDCRNRLHSLPHGLWSGTDERELVPGLECTDGNLCHLVGGQPEVETLDGCDPKGMQLVVVAFMEVDEQTTRQFLRAPFCGQLEDDSIDISVRLPYGMVCAGIDIGTGMHRLLVVPMEPRDGHLVLG